MTRLGVWLASPDDELGVLIPLKETLSYNYYLGKMDRRRIF